MSTEQGNTMIDSRYTVYNTSTGASKGLMNVQRPTEVQNLRTVQQMPLSTIIRTEPVETQSVIVTRTVQIDIEPEAKAANFEAPATRPLNSSDSNKTPSEGSSDTSFDSKEDKVAPATQEIKGEEEPIGVVEVGFGSRGHYLSEGHVNFKVLEAKFRPTAKLDAKNKPYFKFRLGLNTKSTKAVTVEGKNLKVAEDIKVKYTNQDQVRIKVKGKGRLVDNVIAKTKVSIVDVIMEGKQTVWAPLLKGDDVVGELKLEMEFAPKK